MFEEIYAVEIKATKHFKHHTLVWALAYVANMSGVSGRQYRRRDEDGDTETRRLPSSLQSALGGRHRHTHTQSPWIHR